MSHAPLPHACPSCQGALVVDALRCTHCNTSIEGMYEPCVMCRLDPESRRLLEAFLKARGNVRDVQRVLGLSYPTTRQRMDAVFAKVDALNAPPPPRDVLARLRRGEISVDEAERLLRNA